MDWYYANGPERVGPLEDGAFQRLMAEGQVAAETLVWNASLTDWRPWREVQLAMTGGQGSGSLFLGTPAEVSCVECGGGFSPKDGVRFKDSFICAGCKPVYFLRLKQGSVLPGVVRYAGFGPRFCAKMLDMFVLGAASYSVLALTMSGTNEAISKDPEAAVWMFGSMLGTTFAGIGFTLVYQSYFLGRYGATPGKMIMGLRVVMPDLSGISFARALGRAAAEMISGMVCYIGYLMIAFDTESRALHDHIAGTRVIHDEEQR